MNSFLSLLQSTDVSLLTTMRSLIDPTNPLTITIIKHSADILLIVLPLWLALIWLISAYYKTTESKEYALKIFYSAVLGVIFCLLLNALLPMRSRPELASAITPLISHIPDNSFPSMHATFTGATLWAIFLFSFPFLPSSLRKWSFLHSNFIRFLLVFLGIVMVVARVLAGIHYPGDIVAGILLGIISASLISTVTMKKWFYTIFIKYPIHILSFIKL